MSSSTSNNRAFGKVHPAVIVIGCIFLQALLIELWPMKFEPTVLSIIETMGSAFIILGAVVLFLGYRPMIRKGTSIIDAEKHTTHILTNGIFAYSRNPIYFGWFIVFIGMAMANLSWSSLLVAALLIVLLDQFVVLNEEKYLATKFGDQYLSYKAQVRRWV